MNTKRERLSFKELGEPTRKKLLDLRISSSILKGVKNPEKEAEEFFNFKNTRKGWRYIRFYLLKRVDRYRIKNGLEPIHFKKGEVKLWN